MPATYVYIHLEQGPVPAGILRMSDDGRNAASTFQYGRRYLAREDCVALDPVQLPLTEVVQFTPEHFALFNGIRDASPDGWGRHLMDRAAGARVLGEFEYLVATGDTRVGALAFGPDLTGPQRITAWPSAQEIYGEDLDLGAMLSALEDLETLDDLPESHRRFVLRGSSLGGARPKAATELAGRQWLAKFSRHDDRDPVCRIEYAMMLMAGEVGITVPSVRLEQVGTEAVYLVERFDRVEGQFGERRLPFISSLTLLGAHESDSAQYSYRQIAEQLRRFGSRPVLDAAELWRRMVFNILISNRDDHLRNHGFLWDGRGWRLSPAYDLVAFPQVGLERDLALKVGRDGRRATLSNALSETASFGLTRAAALAEAVMMQGIVRQRWETLAAEAGIRQRELERLRTCFMACDEVLQ